jgi:ADP-heptose:LPS heptosyltransferase
VLPKSPQNRPTPGGVKPRPYVLFVPGGSAHRLDKRWPAERYGQLGKILAERGYDIVVIGGLQESALARQIQREVGQARDLTGRTDFAKIAVLGAKAALVVGNDTGPLHLAAATGSPTVVLFSSASDPELAAPRGHVTVLRSGNLGDLSVAEVLQAANALLPPV